MTAAIPYTEAVKAIREDFSQFFPDRDIFKQYHPMMLTKVLSYMPEDLKLKGTIALRLKHKKNLNTQQRFHRAEGAKVLEQAKYVLNILERELFDHIEFLTVQVDPEDDDKVEALLEELAVASPDNFASTPPPTAGELTNALKKLRTSATPRASVELHNDDAMSLGGEGFLSDEDAVAGHFGSAPEASGKGEYSDAVNAKMSSSAIEDDVSSLSLQSAFQKVGIDEAPVVKPGTITTFLGGQRGAIPPQQDLFETPRSATVALFDYLLPKYDYLRKDTFFEPADGRGAISNCIQELGINVVARDKYTLPVSHDFLTAPIPEGVHFICTNAPFSDKYEFVRVAFESGLGFAILVPSDCVYTVTGRELLHDKPFHIGMLSPPVSFTRANGDEMQMKACIWLIGNMPDMVAGDIRAFYLPTNGK